MVGHAKTFGYFSWIDISGRRVFLSLRNEEVSFFLVVLFLEVEEARIGGIVEVAVLEFLVAVVVEVYICKERYHSCVSERCLDFWGSIFRGGGCGRGRAW